MTPQHHRLVLAALAALILLGRPAIDAAQSPPGSREERWREDLDTFAREFAAKQIDAARLYPRLTADVAAIEQALPQSSDADVILALMRLVASAHVGHTLVQMPRGALAFHRLPLVLSWYADGLAVTAATEAYRAAIGLRVARIGALTPGELEAAVAPYISFEHDAWLHQESPSFMTALEILRRLGQMAADGRVVVTLVRSDGTIFEMPVAASDLQQPSRLVTATEVLAVPTALFRKQPDSYYWYEYLPDTRAIYVQYNRCADDPKQPFRAFAAALFAFADAHRVDRVVVDLRFNGGGDSGVIAPLVDGLRARKALRARGHLYTLIGRGTFSSGLLAAVRFRNDLRAVLVGEPSGEKPNSYGEVRPLTLPHSKVVVQYSTKFFRMAKGDPQAFAPDLVVTRTLADALAGRDPVLDAALSHVVR